MSESVPITVMTPVGPFEHNRMWLQDCMRSVFAQEVLPNEILLIEDGKSIPEQLMTELRAESPIPINTYKTPWRAGHACCVNFGVALAQNSLIFWLNSDDMIRPLTIGACWQKYLKEKHDRAYYWVDIEYIHSGEGQALPVIGMLTKKLWEYTGGFPPEASIAACDSIFLNLMQLRPDIGPLIHVESQKPLYLYRVHSQSETATNFSRYLDIVDMIKPRVVANWEPARWTAVQ